MPFASPAPNAPPDRQAGRWNTAGLALLGVWSALFSVAVAVWVYVAFLSRPATADRGLVQLVGAPFVLVALGLLWWAWWSARALRRGRREGWTLLLVLGGVCVAQAVLTAQALLSSSSGAGGSTAPRELTGVLLAVIAFGLGSVVVAVLGRRARAEDTADDAAAPSD